MKSIFLAIIFFLFAQVSGQEKKNFGNSESLLRAISPGSINSWMLISNIDGKENSIYSTKKIENYASQDSGFQLINNAGQFYYIVYNEGNDVKYITDIASLKSFVGTIDNAAEAALTAIADGYFLDAEFHHLAGNYIENKENYILELGKITSTSCPLGKSHFEIIINKKSGNITSVKDNGVYNEVFDKSCENNPHYTQLQKQVEEAKANKEQEAIENKAAKAKAKKKLLKSINKR